METTRTRWRLRPALALLGAAVTWSAGGCQPAPPTTADAPDPLAVLLAPQAGDDELAARIAKLQEALGRDGAQPRLIEQLGWHLVARARRDGDPGLYELALRCAHVWEGVEPGADDAALLRGHALHGLHRFIEAERLARELAGRRGAPLDHALLGDVLLDRGNLDGALFAYQRLMEARPDGAAWTRAAQVRFLTGDLPGAITAMAAAARATSRRDSDAWAWVQASLAVLHLHAGDLAAAEGAARRAVGAAPRSAPALTALGRTRLARGDAGGAADAFARAAERTPLPGLLWAWSEALREAGRMAEAERVEARLRATGARTDPRGFALWLATAGGEPAHARALAQRELESRADVVTWETAAVAAAAAGRHREAFRAIERALLPGVRDARLLYHAGLVAAAAGRPERARRWLREAAARPHILLPSQRRMLAATLRDLDVTEG